VNAGEPALEHIRKPILHRHCIFVHYLCLWRKQKRGRRFGSFATSAGRIFNATWRPDTWAFWEQAGKNFDTSVIFQKARV
jgi:hypothetical protein